MSGELGGWSVSLPDVVVLPSESEEVVMEKTSGELGVGVAGAYCNSRVVCLPLRLRTHLCCRAPQVAVLLLAAVATCSASIDALLLALSIDVFWPSCRAAGPSGRWLCPGNAIERNVGSHRGR